MAVDIADARFAISPALDSAGFELRDAPSSAGNLLDDACVRERYYPAVSEIALLATEGIEAFVFDHQVRRREPDRRSPTHGRHGLSFVGPVGRVHNDYTEASSRRGLEPVIRECVALAVTAVLHRQRVAPIGHAVVDTPLALCDARSVYLDDLCRPNCGTRIAQARRSRSPIVPATDGVLRSPHAGGGDRVQAVRHGLERRPVHATRGFRTSERAARCPFVHEHRGARPRHILSLTHE